MILSSKERIEALLSHLKKSKNAVGVSIGDKNGMRLTHVVSGRNEISEKLAADIVETYPNISYDWLLNGQGEMFKKDYPIQSNVTQIISEPETNYKTKNGSQFFELKNGKFRITVKKIPVKAFASYLSDFQNVEFLEEMEDVSFTVDKLKKGNYLCFEVEEDSMNGGGINDTPDGAELLCRELERQYWKDGFKGAKYGWVIVHNKTVVFKDLVDFDNKTGDITCRSRSGLPQHPDFRINLDDVLQIFKVIKRTF